jgi:hypothetical protein
MLNSPSHKVRAIALNAAGACFVLAAMFHLAVVMRPQIDAGSSLARHGWFVVINVCVAIGLFLRPRFFFWLFSLLVLQQLHGHGRALFFAWAAEHRLDWQSLLVLVVVPTAWWLLWLEYRQSRQRGSS